jgi:hypothetical protein
VQSHHDLSSLQYSIKKWWNCLYTLWSYSYVRHLQWNSFHARHGQSCFEPIIGQRIICIKIHYHLETKKIVL